MSGPKKRSALWKPFGEWKAGLVRKGQWQERSTPAGSARSKNVSPRRPRITRDATRAPAPVRALVCPHCRRKVVR